MDKTHTQGSFAVEFEETQPIIGRKECCELYCFISNVSMSKADQESLQSGESADASAIILCLALVAACFWDVVNKARMSGRSVYCIMSQTFPVFTGIEQAKHAEVYTASWAKHFLFFTGTEQTKWLQPE